MKSCQISILLVASLFCICGVMFGRGVSSIDSLYVITHGDTATIWHKNIESNCASKFAFDVTVGHDTIVVVERDTVGPRARCSCLFDLKVSAVNLFGNYTVMVYRQQLKIYGYQADTIFFAGSVQFSLLRPNLLPYFSITGFQSGCNGSPVSVHTKEVSVRDISQATNYPNPFNSSTNFRFTISAFQFVSLKIFNLLGRAVATLVDRDLDPGEHFVQWNAANFPSGVYFYRLTAEGFSDTRKLLLIK